MEVSEKEMRRFVAKLLNDPGDETLTQRIIRRRFVDYLGVDECSFGDYNKKRLKQIVSETMAPIHRQETPEKDVGNLITPLVTAQKSGLLKRTYAESDNQTSPAENKHQAAASGGSDSDNYNGTFCGSPGKKRSRNEPKDSGTDSDTNNKEDYDITTKTVAAIATIERSMVEESKKAGHFDSGSDSESHDPVRLILKDQSSTKVGRLHLKKVEIHPISSKDTDEQTAKQNSEDESDVSTTASLIVPNTKKVPKKGHRQAIGRDEKEMTSDSSSDSDEESEEQMIKQGTKSKHVKSDTTLKSAVRTENTSDSSDMDESKHAVPSDGRSSSDIAKRGSSHKITAKNSDSSSGSESTEAEKIVSKQDTKQLIDKSKESVNKDQRKGKKGRPSKVKKALHKNEDSTTVQHLKRLIAAAGMRKPYVRLLADCKSEKAKVRVLKGILEDAGVEGRPTLEKCKKLKQKREEEAELADIDPSNIITSTGSTRSARRTSKEENRQASQEKMKNRFSLIISSDESDSH